ncbi:helix-turn-helix domain-containing protein [Blautia producta]|uniref:helix-turn-helix domain-containing protein n=1 Tax=Blautia producta TaxID=33035 RepID=UPI001D007CCF|nr:helix-turn-helix transcriptional regulator [Blautia producta]MCB5875865.1 helix-turn-helix domain-containing protein [Blautia producta]
MTSVEIVKNICKERKIPISKLEKDLGFSNGYISQLKKGVFPADRLKKIADYLDTSIEYLMTGKNSSLDKAELTAKDEREIGRDLDRIMKEIRNGEDGPLFYNGVEMDEKSLILLENAIEYALRESKKENKVKYNPYKNKK